MKTQQERLKPCPFCGGTDLLYHINQAVDACSACIECECCGASGRKYDVKVDQDGVPEDFDEYKQCLNDEWNHRSTEEKLERIIEDAEEEIAELKEELEEVEGFAQEVMELSGITDEVTRYDIENFGVSASNVEDAFRRKFLGDEDNEIHATDGVLKKLAEAEQGAKQAYLKLRESGVLASDWEDDDERKSHYFMLHNGVEETAQRLLQQIKTLVGAV